MRYISTEQARSVLKILIEECSYRVFDQRDAEAFCEAIRCPKENPRFDCREYRFMGGLGFGGKFRNNGNQANMPHVDCYREDETPARLGMIDAANRRLAELFANSSKMRETKE